MKVLCKFNSLSEISEQHIIKRLKRYILNSDGSVDLEIGREYTVYGIVFWDNCPWFYLCAEEDDEYPKPFSAEFFHVLDDSLSPCWRLSSFQQENYEATTSLVFKEWAKDPSFYERLVDGDSDAVTLFAKYRKVIDLE